MSFCPNCGTQIAEGSAFCPECGTKQGGHQPVRRNTTPRGRLHCPSCRSTNLTPVIESSSTIGGAGRISKNIVLTETNIKNKSFWMCQECGHKFRNLEDLIEENKQKYKLGKLTFRFAYIIGGAVALLCSLHPEANIMEQIICACVFGFLFYSAEKWYLKKMKAKSEAEERKLRKACFD